MELFANTAKSIANTANEFKKKEPSFIREMERINEIINRSCMMGDYEVSAHFWVETEKLSQEILEDLKGRGYDVELHDRVLRISWR